MLFHLKTKETNGRMGRKKFHESQNNFVAGRVFEAKDGEPEATRSEIKRQRKQKSIIRLKNNKSRQSKVDRFGRPLNSEGYDSVFVDQNVSTRGSKGNKFAPKFKDTRKVNPKSGRNGVQFAATLLLCFGFFYLMFAHPQYVPLYYAGSIIPLFLYRFISYYMVSR